MRHFALLLLFCLGLSACKLIDTEIACSEFYVKNDLSSTVFIRNYKIIDSGFYFSIDSFSVAAGESKLINEDCRYVDSIIPYPNGNFTKLFFVNGKAKADTFSYNGSIYLHDSINIYNKNRWIISGTKKELKAIYTITALDSLEAI